MSQRRADTTRQPRAGEQHGREYNFASKDAFLSLVDENGFIEHAQFGGNHYGTSVKAVKDVAEKGRICVLDIEMEVGPHFSQLFPFFFLTAVKSQWKAHEMGIRV